MYVCHLDALTGRKVDLFKCCGKFNKDLWCPNVKGIYKCIYDVDTLKVNWSR